MSATPAKKASFDVDRALLTATGVGLAGCSSLTLIDPQRNQDLWFEKGEPFSPEMTRWTGLCSAGIAVASLVSAQEPAGRKNMLKGLGAVWVGAGAMYFANGQRGKQRKAISYVHTAVSAGMAGAMLYRGFKKD